jgi:glutathione S-transferase
MAPHAMLEEIGAKYALKRIDISAEKPRDPEYLQLNPLGRVPT